MMEELRLETRLEDGLIESHSDIRKRGIWEEDLDLRKGKKERVQKQNEVCEN